MESHDAGRVDQRVPALLSGICRRPLWESASDGLFPVGEPGRWSPQMAELCCMQPIVAIEHAPSVDEDWPGEVGLRRVGASDLLRFKRDGQDADL